MDTFDKRVFSDFQKHRQEFVPRFPPSLNIDRKVEIKTEAFGVKDEIKPIFKSLLGEAGMPYVEMGVDSSNGKTLKKPTPLKVGCVLSGGQAPGGHNVISGLYDMVKDINPESTMYGFLKGPHGIFTGNFVEISDDFMNEYRNMGGFDMIRSGRDKIETPQQFEDSLKYCNNLDLDGLVVIGGDDSNTNACLLAEYFNANGSKCKVIGAPKTIDGDLKNQYCEVSFGFDTATKTYAEEIGNILVDTRSSKKYYHFIRLMGRSASHIALECYLQTRPDLVLIGEEIYERNRTLKDVTNEIADIVCKRAEMGKQYGVFLIPEGVIEFFPEMKPLIEEINDIFADVEEVEDPRSFTLSKLSDKSKELFEFLPRAISDQLLLDRDPHGNVQVAKIETEILMILLCQKELEVRAAKGEYNGTFSPQSHYFGYEGRCAIPSNFDTQYCYSIGRTAASLISLGYSGYMAINKNLEHQDPEKWIAAGCPLPTMMGLERRKGKDKPVITKYVVELDGPMFKAYEQFKERWSLYDCYISPGPIQLHDPSSIDIPFLVRPPDLEKLEKETEERIQIDQSKDRKEYFKLGLCNLSDSSKELIDFKAPIPTTLEEGNHVCAAVRRAEAQTLDIEDTLKEQYPNLSKDLFASHFVEVIDKKASKLQNNIIEEDSVNDLNSVFAKDVKKQIKIGVVVCGRQAPGIHNVIDGLLRFADNYGFVQIIGFLNGTKGFFKGEHIIITEENFSLFRNQGGVDLLGRSADKIREGKDRESARDVCKDLALDGLVLIGATHTLTDAAHLSDYFIQEKLLTRVIGVPATIYGNVSHNYVEATVGFDSASKLYSQLIGNIMTDGASAVKYWYLMRLMGGESSHLAVECSLQTGPNIVIISEQSAKDAETLPGIVNRICDIITKRHEDKKNFGTILIPDGLLAHIPHYAHLMQELNEAFTACKSQEDEDSLEEKLVHGDKPEEVLSPWSAAVYRTLPDFTKKQLFLTRQLQGSIELSHIHTEKLISYLIEKELKKRQKEGKGKVPYSPVTHFFGYQGRGSMPSLFDCSLASTYGYTAGVLIQNKQTGMCVTARGLASHPTEWKVGGVPLIAMMRQKLRSSVYGKDKTMIQSEEVDLTGGVYQKVKVAAKEWEMYDRFINPGPIQLFGEGKDTVNSTVYLENKKYSEQVSIILF